jgi:hypothetical protein
MGSIIKSRRMLANMAAAESSCGRPKRACGGSLGIAKGESRVNLSLSGDRVGRLGYARRSKQRTLCRKKRTTPEPGQASCHKVMRGLQLWRKALAKPDETERTAIRHQAAGFGRKKSRRGGDSVGAVPWSEVKCHADETPKQVGSRKVANCNSVEIGLCACGAYRRLGFWLG